MQEEFSGLEFLEYVWRKRHVPAIACVSALVLAAAITFLLPERYTATATVLIEPPAGNDPRAATAVSTVYLESLKTYEHLVSSDTLFAGAIEKLGIRKRHKGSTVEELKRRMLAVSKPVNTSLIEISATLPNPEEAQRLAQTIAEDAVELNFSLDRQSNEALTREADQIYREAKARREQAEQAQAAFLKETSILTLDQQLAAASELRAQVNLDLAREKSSLAAYEGQRTATVPDGVPLNKDWTDMQISAANGRIRELEKQQAQLTEFLSAKSPAIEKIKREQEAIEAELHAARLEEQNARARLAELQSSSAVRRVRITMLDPGIVPQKPSFPNVPLTLTMAFVLAVIGSIAYLAIRFAGNRMAVPHREPAYSRV